LYGARTPNTERSVSLMNPMHIVEVEVPFLVGLRSC
jgi:hypothetical protein